jgi:hypothetical protein
MITAPVCALSHSAACGLPFSWSSYGNFPPELTFIFKRLFRGEVVDSASATKLHGKALGSPKIHKP